VVFVRDWIAVTAKTILGCYDPISPYFTHLSTNCPIANWRSTL